jgi:hypothetical protein
LRWKKIITPPLRQWPDIQAATPETTSAATGLKFENRTMGKTRSNGKRVRPQRAFDPLRR